jgi:hypothetical protein
MFVGVLLPIFITVWLLTTRRHVFDKIAALRGKICRVDLSR